MTARSLAVARNSTSTGTFASQTWDVGFPVDVVLTSVVMDIFAADTYTLKIDGTTVATAVVSGATNGVTFSPAGGTLTQPAGVHRFQLIGTASRRYYYNNAAAAPITGDTPYGVWAPWRESTANTVPATINFTESSSLATAGEVTGANSTSNYSGMTWTVTFDSAVGFERMIWPVREGDTYTLKIDGTTVASGTAASNFTVLNLNPASSVALAAGAHTFSITPTANRIYSYRNDATLVGSSHVTGWSKWAEPGTVNPHVSGLIAFTATPTALTGEWTVLG